mgnify:FL=1
MAAVFFLTFHVIGASLQSVLEILIGKLTELVDSAMTAWGVNPVLHSLVIDGIFNGVGSVLSFLPIIVTLFFFLSILEDSGYMARVAFVMDKLLRKSASPPQYRADAGRFWLYRAGRHGEPHPAFRA